MVHSARKATAAGGILGFLVLVALAGCEETVTILNRSQNDITGVWATDSANPAWGSNHLSDGETIAPEAEKEITVRCGTCFDLTVSRAVPPLNTPRNPDNAYLYSAGCFPRSIVDWHIGITDDRWGEIDVGTDLYPAACANAKRVDAVASMSAPIK
jgi:hypothetical protein